MVKNIIVVISLLLVSCSPTELKYKRKIDFLIENINKNQFIHLYGINARLMDLERLPNNVESKRMYYVDEYGISYSSYENDGFTNTGVYDRKAFSKLLNYPDEQADKAILDIATQLSNLMLEYDLYAIQSGRNLGFFIFKLDTNISILYHLENEIIATQFQNDIENAKEIKKNWYLLNRKQNKEIIELYNK